MGTPLTGAAGSVTLPSGHNARIRAWSATVSQSVNDVTGFAQAPWAHNLGALKSCAGSASGYLEFDAANTDPGAVAMTTGGASMTLTAATGCTLVFDAIITSITLGQSVDGVGTVMFNFVSTDEVVSTWDTTS